MRTLIVTNDFPPRQGGIQSFVHEMARQLAARESDSIAVYASDHPGSAEFDAAQPFPVRRHPSGLLVPSRGARARVLRAFADFDAESVWFGAAAPLALLAPALRRAGARTLVATTHGHEAGWALLPGARQALHRIGTSCDTVTYLGEYFRRRLAPALGRRANLVQLTPGVDVETFCPDVDGQEVRERYGLTDRPVIVCVSRLVRRKGQDTLLAALPAVRRAIPDVALLIVGDGPYRDELASRSADLGLGRHVVFTGGVAHRELPAHFAAGDVFAMPCRTRRAGLDVEGLGIVYLEASATGLPVIAGDSGGAPDAVREGETGYVVGGRDVAALVDRLTGRLADATLRTRLGAAGRAWVEQSWRWPLVAERLAGLLGGGLLGGSPAQRS
jgi:phosphatidyl-myo-inositol dimannoside synthase